MKSKMTKKICRGALIGALYVALTLLSASVGLSGMGIQVRISEALCVLCFFLPEGVAGMTTGCLVANLLTGCVWQDILFGTLATLVGGLGAYAMRNLRCRAAYLCSLPTIVANAVTVPLVLKFAYRLEGAWWLLFLSVGAGEILSAGILGGFLFHALRKTEPYWNK